MILVLLNRHAGGGRAAATARCTACCPRCWRAAPNWPWCRPAAATTRRAQRLPAGLQGRRRYTLATLLELLALRGTEVEVDLDGRRFHAGPALFAATLNRPSYGGGMPALPDARPDDGRLGLLLAGRIGRLQALRLLPRLLAGTHLGHPQARCADFALMRLRASRPLTLAADGEPMTPSTEVDVRVRPGAPAVVARA